MSGHWPVWDSQQCDTMAPLLIATCLLVYTAKLVAKPSFIENDSIVFPESGNDTSYTNISSKLKECIQDDKIEFNSECRSLLTTEGACPDGQWLVLDLLSASLPKPRIRGKCVLRKCPNIKHYWAPLNKCLFSNESSIVCPKGNIVSTDYFGDGFCECNREPVHAKDRSGVCYPVFTRGPCPKNSVWVKVNGRMECREDQCTATRSQFPIKIIVPWTDGKCYAVSERGPCEPGTVVTISMWTLQLECRDPLTPLHLLNPPCTGTDHSGNCAPSVTTPQNNFLNKVADQASKKRTRKDIHNVE